MPSWLQTVATFNPMTYTTDAVRGLLINETTDFMVIAKDFAFVGIFAVVAATIGIVLSWRFLNK
jgi:ABC-type multidrug transport system permease subunit